MTKHLKLVQIISTLNERQIDILLQLVEEMQNTKKEKTPL